MNAPTPAEFKAYRDAHPEAGVWQTFMALLKIDANQITWTSPDDGSTWEVTITKDGQIKRTKLT